MKNIIKKISAVAMAFTLLGAGTVITKKVSPKSDTSISASAASYKDYYLGKKKVKVGKHALGTIYAVYKKYNRVYSNGVIKYYEVFVEYVLE